MITIALLAQRIENPVLQGISGITGAEFFSRVIPNFITLVFVVGILAFVLYFLFGAISWITSGGDKAASETAKHRITQALIGLFILLLLFAILNLIELFFGVNIRGFDIGQLRISATSSPGPGSPGPGSPMAGTGECNCACGNGGYAKVNQNGYLTLGGQCYTCLPGGWTATAGNCSVISCYTACN